MEQPITEPFCGRCGKSLVPLEVLHLSGPCNACDKTVYFVRPGDGGKGIQIERGESFNIPNGWITLSFDPSKTNGRLSRAGIAFLLKRFFLQGGAQGQSGIYEVIQKHREGSQVELRKSDRLAGIDLNASGWRDTAFKRLQDDQNCQEWHLLLKDASAEVAMQGIEEQDGQKAAHGAFYMGLHHGLSVVLEPKFEEMVWRGYQATQAVHEAQTTADHVPGEVEALGELDPLFRKVGEATLSTWINSNVSIGSRMGVKAIPEPLLLARAKWHVENFRAERAEAAKEPSERRANSELRIKWLTMVGAILGSGVIGGVLSKANIF